MPDKQQEKEQNHDPTDLTDPNRLKNSEVLSLATTVHDRARANRIGRIGDVDVRPRSVNLYKHWSKCIGTQRTPFSSPPFIADGVPTP